MSVKQFASCKQKHGEIHLRIVLPSRGQLFGQIRSTSTSLMKEGGPSLIWVWSVVH